MLTFRKIAYVLASLLVACLVARLGVHLWLEQAEAANRVNQRQAEELLVSNLNLMVELKNAEVNFQRYLMFQDPDSLVSFNLAKKGAQAELSKLDKEVKADQTLAVYQRVGDLMSQSVNQMNLTIKNLQEQPLAKSHLDRVVEKVQSLLGESSQLLSFVHFMEMERDNRLLAELTKIKSITNTLEMALAVLTFAFLILLLSGLHRSLLHPLRSMGRQLGEMDEKAPRSLELDTKEPELETVKSRFNSLIERLLQREKELNFAKAQQIEALEQSVREKEEFGSVLAHELRTPLNTLLGTLEIAEDENRLPDQIELTRITEVSRYLIDLVNSTLEYSSMGYAGVDMEMRPFNMSHLLVRVQEAVGGQAKKKGLSLNLDVRLDSDTELMGDELKLQQVLVNLIANAIKFTPSGGRVDVAIWHVVQTTGRRLFFSVKDTGAGIAPSAMQLIFEPFKQANSGIKRKYGGTGIGLALCKRLVNAMGSDIDVFSVEGQGAEFRFSIPMKIAQTNKPTAQFDMHDHPFAGLRVLMVEDHAMNAKINARLLSKLGLNVDCVESGEAALNKLARTLDYDLILMDVNLGEGLTGIETTQLIRAEYESQCPPVIALTAGVMPEMRDKILASGMSAIIEKPFKYQDIFDILNRFVPVKNCLKAKQGTAEFPNTASTENGTQK